VTGLGGKPALLDLVAVRSFPTEGVGIARFVTIPRSCLLRYLAGSGAEEAPRSASAGLTATAALTLWLKRSGNIGLLKAHPLQGIGIGYAVAVHDGR
jgi:hypothetical protein